MSPKRQIMVAGFTAMLVVSSGAATPPQVNALRLKGLEESRLRGSANCVDLSISVTSSVAGDLRIVCSAAREAINRLGRCGIYAHRPLHVQIAALVQHPNKGVVFGLLNTNLDRILIVREENVPSLTQGTPFSVLPNREFYRSLIIHEIVHGIMQQNFTRKPTTRSAIEYSAYALQIGFLTPRSRDSFLSHFKNTEIRNLQLNDIILALDPYAFAALAFRHFERASEKCQVLKALLAGRAKFIFSLPTL